MKKDIIKNFSFFLNGFLLALIFIGIIGFSDTNGVWTFAKDIRPGIFGSDEGADPSNNFTYINKVFFNEEVLFEKGLVSKNKVKTDVLCNENGSICWNVSDLNIYGGKSCASGESLVGFYSNGSLKCEVTYTYVWSGLGDWGSCTPISGTCGAGTQTQTVQCIRNDGKLVSNSYCDPSTNPSTRSCSITCPVPPKPLVTINDVSSTFGCAVGWKNLEIRTNPSTITISASDLRADYHWKGSGDSDTKAFALTSSNYPYINYAYGRDNLELKITPSGDLVGRCKGYQSWFTVQSNILCNSGYTFDGTMCSPN